jgi:hypothetical protein
MNRMSDHLPPEDEPPPKTKLETNVSEESQIIRETLMGAFYDGIDGQSVSGKDILVGLTEFVTDISRVCVEGGIVPPDFSKYLTYNIQLNFDIAALGMTETEAVPILGPLTQKHFAGTLGNS